MCLQRKQVQVKLFLVFILHKNEMRLGYEPLKILECISHPKMALEKIKLSFALEKIVCKLKEIVFRTSLLKEIVVPN